MSTASAKNFPDPPVDVKYSIALQSKAEWLPLGAGFHKRDLGLGGSTSGSMEAVHVRASFEKGARRVWQREPSPFHFLFVLAGSGTLTTNTNDRVSLGKWTCIHQSDLFRRNEIEVSPDFEAIEIFAPEKASSPAKLVTDAANRLTVTQDTPDSYVVGDGPRRFFGYRDLRIAAVTDRRVHIHVVKAAIPMNSGTGWHAHSMSQQFYVIQGWADVSATGQPLVRMTPNDAMCLRAGMPHDVSAFSADYGVLEMCLPADYSTVDAAPAA